jgi:hypothetical protein
MAITAKYGYPVYPKAVSSSVATIKAITYNRICIFVAGIPFLMGRTGSPAAL